MRGPALAAALLWLWAAMAAAAPAGLPDFVSLVAEQAPAVVNIRTVPKVAEAEEGQRSWRNFGERFVPRPEGGLAPAPPQRGLGSGFILTADGVVVTNHHVVADAAEIYVRLPDRREFAATVVGQDPRSDLAVLQLDAEDLPTVTIGRSDALQVGEWVLAIGSPFGFEHSVTAGIVSAKGRSLPAQDIGNYVPFLQTDVAINPGNSGGPLFNLAGEVVGVNAQIYTRSGGFMGMSFAIPIDTAMAVVRQLRSNGAVSRGWLGVEIRQVTREDAAKAGLDRPSGAVVRRVLADSPAERAGLLAEDIITLVAGRSLDLSSELPHVVGALPAGSTVPLRVVRDGEALDLDVTLGELAAVAEAAVEPPGAPPELGVAVAAAEDTGVVVLSLVDGGPGAAAGLLVGDVILRLDNQPVTDEASWQTLVAALQAGQPVPVLVLRDGNHTFLALTP